MLFAAIVVASLLQVRVATNATNCLRWTRKYDGVKADNVVSDCVTGSGAPLCCAAVAAGDGGRATRGVGHEDDSVAAAANIPRSEYAECGVSRVYRPSLYELEHFRLAQELEGMGSARDRELRLLRYISSADEIRKNYLWLKRVRQRARNLNENVEVDAEDVLSSFEVSERCIRPDGSADTTSWIEWIEPITVHGRHPFAFAQCRHLPTIVSAFPHRLAKPAFKNLQRAIDLHADLDEFPSIPAAVSIMNVDYILLQSAESLYGLRRRNSIGRHERYPIKNQIRNKHFMLDAGSSTFDSSLFWFTCAYSQVSYMLIIERSPLFQTILYKQLGISFDKVFAWEKNLLNPISYWGKVPVKWHPYWTLFNIPIGTTSNHTSKAPSPLKLVQQFAKRGDFISFKLDVDHVEIELGLAHELLSDDKIAALVDEFFIEIHFRCEIMTQCGWKSPEFKTGNSLGSDRLSVMQYFRALREKGVRSHFWP